MKLRVLEDNNTFIDEYYLGEPAVSYYIENENEKILFDTGYSDAFIQNAKKMSIDLNQVQKIVLSHGHNDHTGGLPYLLEEVKNKNITLIAHENCFEQKILEQEEIGSPITREVLAQACQLKLTKQPVKVSKNITFLGEIPDIHLFEKREQISTHISDLDKEATRLNANIEKQEEANDNIINYMWEEYELTYSYALPLKDENLTITDMPSIKSLFRRFNYPVNWYGADNNFHLHLRKQNHI